MFRFTFAILMISCTISIAGGIDMSKLIYGLVFGAAIFGIATHISQGQVATAEVKTKEIRQGDTLSMDVSVDRAPNLDGRIVVRISPDGGGLQIEMNCTLNRGETKCQTGTRLPLDAKLGKWMITAISFQSFAQAPVRELVKGGSLFFQVTQHQEIILPNNATVSDLK
jgi:hypothetical protein